MIFISYRIADTGTLVARLNDSLTAEFGRGMVFRDKSSLQGGQDWPAELEQNAKDCRVMLVVIGKLWDSVAHAKGPLKGYLRLLDPADCVRREIATGLSTGCTVIPVFADGGTMPDEEWLKNFGLERLYGKQGVQVRTDEYDTDLPKLVKVLRERCPVLPAKSGQAGPTPAAGTPVRPPRTEWTPAVLYPLQPAPHFVGREELLKDLSAWAADPAAAARVVALVAAGGTGKTAVAERALAALPGPFTFGVFVWSFYENPQTEAFLREACAYFTGEEPKEAGGLLERLQRALTGPAAHLLILDGLELVQATGTTGRPRGEVEDPLLKRLLRWLAAGLGTAARALITSRFPLPDLHAWLGGGRFREEHLDDLPAAAAVGVLRRWGVKGTDRQLQEALRPLRDDRTGRVHALSASVLGSYLGRLWGGEVTKAPTFDPHTLAGGGDPTATRLTRILASYAEKLPAAERDLLARLSLFPRGETVEVIGYMVDAGGEVAGRLIGCGQVRVVQMLEGLRDLGLVFRYDAADGRAFTAHPFVRQFFAGLCGVTDPAQIHEAVRARLAPRLDERPVKKPTRPADLDRYERLIEATRLAGQAQRAFDLYWLGLGCYNHLGKVLGDHARGLRIVSAFAANGTPATAGGGLTHDDLGVLVTEWGLFAADLGDLATARQAFEIAIEILRQVADDLNLSQGWRNLAEIELLAGRWPAARDAAAAALTHAERACDTAQPQNSYAYAAAAWAGLGRVAAARDDFREATDLNDEPQLYSVHGIRQAELKLATGDRAAARSQTEANQAVGRRRRAARDVAWCDALLGRCSLPADPAWAGRRLAAARAYAGRSGDIDATLRCYHLAADIARHEADVDRAAAEAAAGIQLADSCGFGQWSIDLRLELARAHLAAGDPRAAVEPGEEALARSEHPDCQYAWGVADALHLLGVAHARLGDADKARDYLRRAAAARKPLEHAGLPETEAELAHLGG